MTSNPDTSLTIDTHHHILSDFFWRETENAHAPVGGLAPLRWSKDAIISFMDDVSIDVAARFAIIDEMGFIAGGEQQGAAMFRRIYWDTALAASNPVLHMLRDVAGIDQVLYGTDFPYLRRDLAVSSKQRISQSVELDDSEKRAIFGGNASRLFRACILSFQVVSILN